MYNPDTPIQVMLDGVREHIIELAKDKGMENFDPIQDCPGYQWWLNQNVPTVNDFVDRVIEGHATGEVETSWVTSFLICAWSRLDKSLREKLTALLDGDAAICLASWVNEFTPNEVAHLRKVCKEHYRLRPVQTKILLREKLSNASN